MTQSSKPKTKSSGKSKALVFQDISELLTMSGAAQKHGRRVTSKDLGVLKNAALVVLNGCVKWVGCKAQLPREFKRGAKVVSLKGQTVLPAFLDCHTHTVFAGDRTDEFEMRIQGKSYQDIGKSGGGILSTVNATRKASTSELLKLAQSRADKFVQQGITTLEVKSGYGLSLKDEVRILEVAKKVKGPKIVTTFLGPHAKSPDFGSLHDYLDKIIEEHLPVVAKKKSASRADIFIESGYFSRSDGEKYIQKAKELGFDIVIHANQLTPNEGADLAVSFQAKSADHLVHLTEDQVRKLSQSEVTCVLLPSSDFYMGIPYPNARALINSGARIALSTDFNPGSSPSLDFHFMCILARTQMKMTLPEVISAVTVGPAFALSLESERGSLQVGKRADFIAIEGEWNKLFYEVGRSPISGVWRDGRQIFRAKKS
ncbi:MAG: imidazolonepropionase [Bdellovibrionales bacterium]|nr:imidazolonepropionase [Bdellovibrionales bacterium]